MPVKPTVVIEDAGGEGGRFAFDLLRDRLEVDAAAACYRGLDARGRRVFVKEVDHGDEEGRERAERELAALRRLGRHPGVVCLLGATVTPSARSYRVFEWADTTLAELLPDCPASLRPTLAGVLEDELSAALRAVHAAGLVHCDVAPNNVVRVEGRWKLADFDVCVPAGEPTVGQPQPERYRTPGREVGMPARPQFDWDGLRAVLAQVRGG